MDLTEREKEMLNGLDDAAKAHPLVRSKTGVLHFEQKLFPEDRQLAIREAWEKYWAGTWDLPKLQGFYRDIGYSVSGYIEVLIEAD